MFTDGLTQRARRAAVLAALAVTLPVGSASAETDTTQFSVEGGSLGFEAAPNLPGFSAVTLNGQSQNVNAQMSNWTVTDSTGAGSGWNVTVQGDNGAGRSAVFKEYCTDPAATNGCDTAVNGGVGPGYVTSSPETLAANSLSLSSTGAAFTAQQGTTGTAPTHQCGSSCYVDTAVPVKIAGSAVDAGMGTYRADTYDASSLGLALPTTVQTIGTGNKVYRLDLTWSINSGP